MNKSPDQIELEEVEKELDSILNQYKAVSKQKRLCIDEGEKVVLEARCAELYRQGRALESRIANLKTLLQPPSPQSKGLGALPEEPAIEGPVTRWAVLVGVNRYLDKITYGSLQVCARDAEAIGERLREDGYKNVSILTDKTNNKPTRNEILMALQTTAEQTKPNDLLLFYFSGHGEVEKNKAYLIARDTYQRDLEETAVALSKVKETMRRAAANKKVIIVDACHAGANLGGKGARAMSKEFIREVYEKAKGWATLASCEQNQKSYEWLRKNQSAFTHFLLEALSGKADFHGKGLISVQDAHIYVLDRVKAWAAEKRVTQTPTLQTEVAGDIILVDLRK